LRSIHVDDTLQEIAMQNGTDAVRVVLSVEN